MEIIKRPSIIRIIETDYFSLIMFLFPIVGWAFIFILRLLQNQISSEFVYFWIIVTVFALSSLLWRYSIFTSVFEDGQEVQGVISNLSFFRDRGRIDYTYTFQAQKYLRGNAVHKSKRVQALTIGDPVTLVVDRNNPGRAFIRDLYL